MQKPKSTPAKCIPCSGDHPANYKGCTVNKDLVAARYRTARGHQPIQSQQTNQEEFTHRNTKVQQATYPQYYQKTYTQQTTIPQHNQTYAQAVKSNNQTETSTNMENQFSTFLNEFTSMFAQLISQKNMILNLLTTVIGKLSSLTYSE
jgi:hypothetical protein